jgi:hypothetical protein
LSTAATATFPAASIIRISAPSQLVVAGLQTRQRDGRERPYHLSGSFVSACDLSSALGRLFSAVAQGHVKPKTASTLAYLGQTLVQILPIAQDEYINAYDTDTWRETIRESHEQSAKHTYPAPPSPIAQSPAPEPAAEPAPAPTPETTSDASPASEQD